MGPCFITIWHHTWFLLFLWLLLDHFIELLKLVFSFLVHEVIKLPIKIIFLIRYCSPTLGVMLGLVWLDLARSCYFLASLAEEPCNERLFTSAVVFLRWVRASSHIFSGKNSPDAKQVRLRCGAPLIPCMTGIIPGKPRGRQKFKNSIPTQFPQRYISPYNGVIKRGKRESKASLWMSAYLTHPLACYQDTPTWCKHGAPEPKQNQHGSSHLWPHNAVRDVIIFSLRKL